jgi:serine/threonine-protein kinase
LRQSQLLPPEQVQRIEARIEASGLDTAVVADLVKEGMLTSYQIRLLESGRGKDLMLGQYRILEELGRGGFGCVYKAAHVLMDRVVALKVVAPERVEVDRTRTMFLREVRAATRLHHPNIALAYDAGEADGRLFMALEYIEGPTLDQLVRHNGPLPLNLAWSMLQQAAHALRYAHEQGMVHRDIKPANLLIPRPATAGAGRSPLEVPTLLKVVDFGLARLQQSKLQSKQASGTLFASKDNVFAGTPDYMSPEQARDLHDVDIRSDLYSLGCTFYFALTGRKPFAGSSALEIVFQHWEKAPDPVQRWRPDVPAPLSSLISRLMEKQPGRRFQTPEELLMEMGYMSIGGIAGIAGSHPAIALPSWPSVSVSLPAVAGSSPHIALPPLAPEARTTSPRATIAREQGADLPEENLAATIEIPAPDELRGAQQAELLLAPDGAEMPSPQPTPAPAEPAVEAPGATLVAVDTQGEPAVPVCPTWAPHNVSPDREIRLLWEQWHRVVSCFASGAPPEVSPTDYKTLHDRLLQGLRSCATGDESRQYQYRRLEVLVQPWVSLPVLGATEPGILRDLAARAEGLARDLGIRPKKMTVPFWLVAAALILLLVGVSGISSVQVSGGRLWHPPSLQTAWHFLQANPILSLTLLLPGGVLGALWGVSRVIRQVRG